MVLYVYLLGSDLLQLAYVIWDGTKRVNETFIRAKAASLSSFNPWTKIATMDDIPDVSALTSRIATLQAGLDEIVVMQTRLQALETRVKSLETN